MSPEGGVADRPARILIVDDEPYNRQLLEGVLVPQGYDVVVAATGDEAIAMIGRQPPDLMLLDIMMPGMDGYEVARRIKENIATEHIPIIMVTSLDDRETRIRGLNAGAEDFLTKPVDLAEVLVRVRNLLRLKAHDDDHAKHIEVLEDQAISDADDLDESERLYRSTFDAAPVGIAHVALDGRWLQVNQRLCDLLGYSCEQLQSAAVQELLRSEEVAEGGPPAPKAGLILNQQLHPVGFHRENGRRCRNFPTSQVGVCRYKGTQNRTHASPTFGSARQGSRATSIRS